MKKPLLLTLLLLGTIASSARADQLLIDGDFSTNPGSGSPAPADLGSGSYAYVTNSGTATNVGGAGGWTFQNGVSAPSSAIYMVNTSGAYSEGWIPQAAASNTNGYVVQLDTISTLQPWTTGNAVYQTVTVVAGNQYQLTFSINTEHTSGGESKAQLSAADVMVTNANNFQVGTSSGTVSTSDPNNLNALTYGNVQGYQYTVDTSSVPNGGNADTWATYTMGFTATSNSIQIAIADDPLSVNSNISLESISLSTVPEPREWAMFMLLGVAAIVGGRKLRSQVLARQVID